MKNPTRKLPPVNLSFRLENIFTEGFPDRSDEGLVGGQQFPHDRIRLKDECPALVEIFEGRGFTTTNASC